MNLTRYQLEAKRTRASLDSKLMDNLHMVMGISTEAGELLDAYKKHVAYNQCLDDINIKEELGDLMWYIINLCDINDWDLSQILETNISKLAVRYPHKFESFLAKHRNLNEERIKLEAN